MGWNENIKKILDFIPIFERQVKENESLESRVEALENAKIEPIEYDDSELRKEIARFNELFDSFRRTEGEQSAIAIGNVNKQIRELSKAIEDTPKPYDDSKLVDMINDIEKHDDTDITKEIETIKKSVEAIKPYNDEALIKKLVEIEGEVKGISIPAPYDDSPIRKAIDSIKPFDDSKLKADIKKLSESMAKIKPYNDAAIKKSIKAINQTLIAIKPYDDAELKRLIKEIKTAQASYKQYDDSAISKRIDNLKPYDDKAVKRLISELSSKVSKMMSDHKKENSGKIKQLAKETPKPYDDGFISGRIEKQGEAIAELSGQVSKLKQLFEVD